ncbi:MAG: Type 1 glutamine amidotransferase-like domain-containing protein [Gammaproteobacteria bacterium]|nr:Type 1 glutamine amidotransferase-like domain-containing protein [Gammaproteobacteria bacterium]
MSTEQCMRLILGPQSPAHNIDAAMMAAGLPEGTFATITAGWQEAENDIDTLREIVGRPLVDLRLYARADDVFRTDEALAAAHRERQNRLKEQQRLYRLRLKQLAVAARHTLRADGDAAMVAAEKRHAIAQLRALDRHHLHRTESIGRPFGEQFNVTSSPLLARHHEEIREVINGCSVVLISGGNVAVLLNRLRLFGVDSLLANRHVVAWSAGAMVLAERVVLFHDRSPQGRRDAEIFGTGCGLVSGHVYFPDASHRLQERDRSRIELLCRRFAPDTCVALDNGAALEVRNSRVATAVSVRRLSRDGRIVRLRAA